jgi:hypothetical protein
MPCPQADLEGLAAGGRGAAQPELDLHLAVVEVGQLDQLIALIGHKRTAVDPVLQHVVGGQFSIQPSILLNLSLSRGHGE